MAADSIGKPYLDHIGLQAWTVRRELEQDLPGTLRAVKAAGYAQLELMDTVNARAFVPHARELGLGLTSAFMDWTAIVQPDATSADRLADTVKVGGELGLKYLVFGYIGKGQRETVAQMRGHATAANAFGRQCRDAGLQLCYHHHAFEFAPLAEGRRSGWDILLENLDPGLVKLELDIFWAALAGFNPVSALEALKGRIAQVHLKDLKAGTPRQYDEGAMPPESFKELGQGCLDLKKIIETCAATGVDQCHVEQDQSPDPLASIATSINFLRQRA
jgi:sugar phosphate isomerase/epimerase